MTDSLAGQNPELAQLISRIAPQLAPGGGPLPPSAPRPGQPHDQWLGEVATVRARHDSSALDADRLFHQVLTEQLGADPLGLADTRLGIEWHQMDLDDAVIGLRVTRPQNPGPHPVIVLVHGGGYWMGGGSAGWRLNDLLCRTLAAQVPAVVVSVDHRLAPEHQFPIPLDDVCAAVSWTVGHAGDLDIDPARMALYGISSGGNLVCGATHRSLDGDLPPVRAVVLQNASVNLSLESGRFTAAEAEVAAARQIVAIYAGTANPLDPAVSPGLREQLAGLPPTMVITADFDPLTADALAYADRLEAAQVEVTRHAYPMTHTLATPDTFVRLQQEAVAWLQQALR